MIEKMKVVHVVTTVSEKSSLLDRLQKYWLSDLQMWDIRLLILDILIQSMNGLRWELLIR